MPNVKVFNMEGREVGEIALSELMFGAEVNAPVLHSAVRAYLLNQRQGTQSTKTRSEVSGGGKKPWRQKGTGRARQGSTRSPQWTHGGIALGPKPRSYRTDLNKKMKRVALFSALSDKVATGNLVVLDECKLEGYKTAKMVKMFRALGAVKENGSDAKALLVLPESDRFIVRSVRNIPTAETTLFSTINSYEIVNADKLIITKDALEKLTAVYDCEKEVQD
ncbi:MAG: 50S ribosomal protein L4 [Clostridia bacterium]|nr:50S ribosomal protein L4 [Clostridia bacterium]